jgi:outer membrane protein OmpA-like peptidoglycan-associated protein
LLLRSLQEIPLTQISIVHDRAHGRAADRLNLILVMLLVGCPAASPLAATARFERSTDTERNSRELQRQLDELLFRGPQSVVILPRGDLFFASGTDELDSTSRTHLEELASFLIRCPRCTVAIKGHTDNVGNRKANHRLSLRRAEVVKAYLVRRGVDTNAVSVAGRGEASPLAENSSGEGRQWNRRVEVILENLPLSKHEGD